MPPQPNSMSQMAQSHVQRFETLRSDRSSLEQKWRAIADRVLPSHQRNFDSAGMGATKKSRGNDDRTKQFDATAALALTRFSAVMESLATPQNSVWHRLVPGARALRKNRRVKGFLDEVNDILYDARMRPEANFIGNIQQVYQSLGAFGTGAMHIDAGPERELRYRACSLGQMFLVEDVARRVRTVYRCYPISGRDILSEFGQRAPDSILNVAGNEVQLDEEHDVLHVVVPNRNYDPNVIGSFPFGSTYIFLKTKHVMSMGGYSEFPYAISRYTQAPDEVYGRGPAEIVLADIKVLNEIKKDTLTAGHRALNPVLLTHDDGDIDALSIRPGAVNPGTVSAEGRPLVHALPMGDIRIGKELSEQSREVINDSFLVRLFQILVDNPRMTATEVMERAREKGMLLAPTAGRQHAELLGPMISRELSVLQSLGRLPEIPRELAEAGGVFNIEYDNPLARLARAEKAAGLFRSLDAAAAYVQATGDPSPYDWIDFDAAMPDILDINAVPAKWMREPQVVEAIRADRRKRMQEQQAIQAAPAVGGLLKTAAEAQKP